MTIVIFRYGSVPRLTFSQSTTVSETNTARVHTRVANDLLHARLELGEMRRKLQRAPVGGQLQLQYDRIDGSDAERERTNTSEK